MPRSFIASQGAIILPSNRRIEVRWQLRASSVLLLMPPSPPSPSSFEHSTQKQSMSPETTPAPVLRSTIPPESCITLTSDTGTASSNCSPVPSPPHVLPMLAVFCLASNQSTVCVLRLYCVLPVGQGLVEAPLPSSSDW